MRWWSGAVLVVCCACVLAEPGTAPLPYNDVTVTASVSVSVLGSRATALTLRDLVSMTLNASGVKVETQDSPLSCAQPDSVLCFRDTLRWLSSGHITAAVITVPSEQAPADSAPWYLREEGIEELNNLAPPSRRACLTTSVPARSLLDLADPSVAAVYSVPTEDIILASELVGGRSTICTSDECKSPDWCKNVTCAIILTSSVEEAKVFSNVIHQRNLYAKVVPVGSQLGDIAAKLSNRPIIACDWAAELSLAGLKGETLGPPPCLQSDVPCPFETRRHIKLVNIRAFATAPNAVKTLVRLKLNNDQLRDLDVEARLKGHEVAAREFFKKHPAISGLKEIRVAVLLPDTTSREAYDGYALHAAAALAEDDLSSKLPSIFRFKVETYDDMCDSSRAYKYLNDAQGTGEYGGLSALAGPACGAPWADVARQVSAHHIPMLAYTPQAPEVGVNPNDTQLQLLAGGDARQSFSALKSLLLHMGWRRMGVLNEKATNALYIAAKEDVEFVASIELPGSGQTVDQERISKWAKQVADANAHIVYLCVEDARVARAALCTARDEGLMPDAGTVWLLCRAPSRNWLEPGPNENCTRQQLEEVATGYITVTPEWQLDWENGGTNTSIERRNWEGGWQKYCRMEKSANVCSLEPSPNAALLYDTLQIWVTALEQFLTEHPMVIDLHNPLYVNSLIKNTVATNFTGLTGHFDWVLYDGAYARRTPFILSQWDPQTGKTFVVGRWTPENFTLDITKLRWYTSDGKAPDDGREYCTLHGIATALNCDCRTAYIALASLLAGILVLILAAGAYYCKKRADKEYRKRLAELGMRHMSVKPIRHDRWEIPRERVVINRKLGTGAFGMVYGGHALLAEDRGWSAVAVKTLKAGAIAEEKLDFLSEAEAMKRFDHKNVVRLLGVITKTEPVCTVMEFMLYGDLKNYLLARRHLAMCGGNDDESCGEADEASPRRLTGMALDVARALSYLAQLRYVHRDVAARNCLVSSKRVVKLADFGMTRLVFENDYYRFSRKGMLPVRWMAPESLALGVFSPSSDVWSFGVLLYEIVTFGSLPFQGLSNSEVLTRVKSGHTLELPPGLKPQLEELINSCWQSDCKSRPTASDLATFLADAPCLLNPCLDVPLDALSLDADPPWRLPREQAEARWVSWAAPASQATDTTYLSTDGAVPLDTDSFLP